MLPKAYLAKEDQDTHDFSPFLRPHQVQEKLWLFPPFYWKPCDLCGWPFLLPHKGQVERTRLLPRSRASEMTLQQNVAPT